MARFTEKVAVNWQGRRGRGGQVIMMTKPGTKNLEFVQEMLGYTLGEAHDRLFNTLRTLNGPAKIPTRIVELAHQYFLTDAAKIANEDFQILETALAKTHRGLILSHPIKIGKDILKADEQKEVTERYGVTYAMGAVQRYINQEPNHGFNKKYHTLHDSLGKPEVHVMGMIKLETKTFKGPHAIVTLLHEALHKYADTDDFWWYDSMGNDSRGPGEKTKANALNNADSYAWFTFYAGQES